MGRGKKKSKKFSGTKVQEKSGGENSAGKEIECKKNNLSECQGGKKNSKSASAELPKRSNTLTGTEKNEHEIATCKKRSKNTMGKGATNEQSNCADLLREIENMQSGVDETLITQKTFEEDLDHVLKEIQKQNEMVNNAVTAFEDLEGVLELVKNIIISDDKEECKSLAENGNPTVVNLGDGATNKESENKVITDGSPKVGESFNLKEEEICRLEEVVGSILNKQKLLENKLNTVEKKLKAEMTEVNNNLFRLEWAEGAVRRHMNAEETSHFLVQLTRQEFLQTLRLPLEASAGYKIARNMLTFAFVKGDESLTAAVLKAVPMAAVEPSRSKSSVTPLHEACYFWYDKHIKPLLAAGAPVNQRNRDGFTALHIAAGTGNWFITKTLIEAGADVHLATREGITPLHLAAQNCYPNYNKAAFGLSKGVPVYPEVIIELVKGGASLEAKTKKGITPLFLAVARGNFASLRMLLALGADSAARDLQGRTVLHQAAISDRSEFVSILTRSHGIGVDCRDNKGYTPLHLAASFSHEVYDALLREGANPMVVGPRGTRPFDIMIKKKFEEEAEECFFTIMMMTFLMGNH